MSSILLDPKTLIKNASDNIDNNISILCPNHIGLCAQNILSQSRNLIDALVIYKHRLDCPCYIPNSGNDALEKAYTYINHCNKIFKPLIAFHRQLEIIASHYTQNLFDSESLLFRYSDTLYEIKRIADAEFGIQILKNLDDFPFSFSDVDYYEKIKAELDKTQNEAEFSYNTYYIEKKIRRPFGIFEYVLSPANDKTTKFDRLTVFSFENIHSRNAIQCAINKHKIIHNEIPIIINSISTWSYSIRPCELNKLSRIVGSETGIKRTTNGYKLLMSELTKDNISLFDFVNSNNFDDSLSSFQLKPTNKIYLFLTKIKRTIEKCEIGRNTIRYLLYICRHSIIKNQLAHDDDNRLGNTHLKSGCYPFDSHPFSFSLIKHNPRLEDLLDCLYDCCTNDELLKRSLVVNTENKKKLYTPVKELDKYFLTKELADVFNKKLDERKKESSICFYNDFAYIQSYENHTISILNKLLEKSESGDESYLDKAKDYIKTIKQDDIDECKLNILKQAFNDSSVVLINGAAGTGKTTLIKHFSNIFKNEKVLFLSCTNSSVQNLKIRVGKASGRDKKDFMTIESFLQKSQSHGFSRYSILVVDECSMVENDAFDKILCTHNFEKMLLVGDEKQIESIRFGNWFGIANKFLKYCFELSINHRTADHNLALTWDMVRDLQDKNGIVERIIQAKYHHDLNKDLFIPKSSDEVILCLNYDGLYGINNINRYLQELNEEKPVSWKVWTFKKGDKILFNESYYFRDFFYNNQKGTIENIEENEEMIVFVISVSEEETNNHGFSRFVQWIKSENNHDYYKITIFKDDDDDEEDNSKAIIVPFQLGYAISIHKSQGLEYDSVKVVFTHEVEEQITHNIFYTAITRAKKYISIFCDKTSLSNIVNKFEKQEYDNDSRIIGEKFYLKRVR